MQSRICYARSIFNFACRFEEMEKIRMVWVAIVLAAAITGLFAYPHMPESMATHWNISG